MAAEGVVAAVDFEDEVSLAHLLGGEGDGRVGGEAESGPVGADVGVGDGEDAVGEGGGELSPGDGGGEVDGEGVEVIGEAFAGDAGDEGDGLAVGGGDGEGLDRLGGEWVAPAGEVESALLAVAPGDAWSGSWVVWESPVVEILSADDGDVGGGAVGVVDGIGHDGLVGDDVGGAVEEKEGGDAGVDGDVADGGGCVEFGRAGLEDDAGLAVVGVVPDEVAGDAEAGRQLPGGVGETVFGAAVEPAALAVVGGRGVAEVGVGEGAEVDGLELGGVGVEVEVGLSGLGELLEVLFVGLAVGLLWVWRVAGGVAEA